jgi:RNA-directed DNA polymerase
MRLNPLSKPSFMAERGLVLSPEKTVITHIDQGLDFLGWTVRRFGKGNRGKVLVQPSKKNVKALIDKCRRVFREMRVLAA